MKTDGDDADTYRVALIGYGIGGAVFHAPLVSAVEGLALTAIVTRSAQKIEQVKRDFPQAKVLISAEEIFANAKDYDLLQSGRDRDAADVVRQNLTVRPLCGRISRHFPDASDGSIGA